MEIRKGTKKAMIHSSSPYKKQGGFLHHTLSLLPPVVPFFLSFQGFQASNKTQQGPGDGEVSMEQQQQCRALSPHVMHAEESLATELCPVSPGFFSGLAVYYTSFRILCDSIFCRFYFLVHLFPCISMCEESIFQQRLHLRAACSSRDFSGQGSSCLEIGVDWPLRLCNNGKEAD